MLSHDRSIFPVLAFLVFYLPVGTLALVLGLWAMPQAPHFAPLIQLGFGTAAFAIAVEGAAACCLRSPSRLPLIQRLLCLRRCRRRYALIFGLLGASFAGIADLCAGACGIALAFSAGAGRIALAVPLLILIAWILIGVAGARRDLVRRAFHEAMASRP